MYYWKTAEANDGRILGKAFNVNNVIGTIRDPYKHGDYMRFNETLQEEAEEYAKYLKALEKYRYNFSTDEIKNANIDKYFVEYDIDKDEMFSQFYRYYVTNKILFKTENDCENFIKEVGEENIKKFMFDIWE